MQESKSKFVKWVNECVKWVAATKSRRFGVLLICGGMGFYFGVFLMSSGILTYLSPDLNFGSDEYTRFRNNNLSLAHVVGGLFVFTALWVFRTMDTREQIEKAQEQLEKAQKQLDKTQEQINFGFYSEAKKSFFNKGNFKERTAGFIQLTKLQQRKLFQEEIKIVFRKNELNRPKNEEGDYLDEEGAYLKRVDLSNIDLSDTEFGLEGANLEGAILKKANLKGVSFERAKLHNANLLGANLQGVNLEGAELYSAKLLVVNLLGANLLGANLERAILRDAKLRGVSLQHAKFNHATDLTGADMQNAVVLGTGLNDNALRSAGVNLSDTQWKQLKYERP